MNYSELTKKQKKQVIEESGYSAEDLESEDPYFIPCFEFETYTQELAEDIGAIGKDSRWPINCIDWEQASLELKMDYSEVEIDGQSYYFRAW